MNSATTTEKISYFDKVHIKMLEAIRSGKEVYDLSIGDPDLPSISDFGEYIREALNHDQVFSYPSLYGEENFLESISYWFYKKYSIKLNPYEQILPILGVKEGIYHLAQGLLNHGDYGAFVTPSYPMYEQAIISAGGNAFSIPSYVEDNYVPKMKDIPYDIKSKLKLLYLNYPQNPTGANLNYFEKREIMNFCIENKINTCWDATYSRISSTETEDYMNDTVLSIPGAIDYCIEMYSFSKDFNLPGIRLGFAVGSKHIIDQLKKIKTNVDVCSFKAIQAAAAKLLHQDADSRINHFFNNNNIIYASRLEKVKKVLIKYNIKFFNPRGTFFLWLQVPSNMTDIEFCDRLFEEQNVLLVPGCEFNDTTGKWCRVTLSKPDDVIEKFVDILDSFMKGITVNDLC